MTTQEAIEVLKNDIEICTIQQNQACDMAIKTLEQQPKIDEIIKRIEETRDKDKLCEYPYNRCIKIIREVLGDD